MLDMHGLYYLLDADFRVGQTASLAPWAGHLKMTPDFCIWRDRLVMAGDDTSSMDHRHRTGGQPQSNLWFGSVDALRQWGPVAGWGGPWLDDEVCRRRRFRSVPDPGLHPAVAPPLARARGCRGRPLRGGLHDRRVAGRGGWVGTRGGAARLDGRTRRRLRLHRRSRRDGVPRRAGPRRRDSFRPVGKKRLLKLTVGAWRALYRHDLPEDLPCGPRGDPAAPGPRRSRRLWRATPGVSCSERNGAGKGSRERIAEHARRRVPGAGGGRRPRACDSRSRSIARVQATGRPTSSSSSGRADTFGTPLPDDLEGVWLRLTPDRAARVSAVPFRPAGGHDRAEAAGAFCGTCTGREAGGAH